MARSRSRRFQRKSKRIFQHVDDLCTDLGQDNHHYANPQCGTPFYSIDSSPFDPTRIGFQGEFGGVGNNATAEK